MPDQVFNITAEDGAKYRITAPEGTTEEQIREHFSEQQSKGALPAKSAQEHLQPAEPSFGARVAEGALAPFEAVVELYKHVTGKTDSPEPAEATVNPKTGRISETKKRDPLDPARMLGGLIGPSIAAVGALGKLAPEMGPMARSMIGGGISGVSQPTEGAPEDFWKTKGKQAIAGTSLGYGFSVGGKILSKGAEALGSFISARNPEALENRAVQAILQRINESTKAGGPTAQQMLDLIQAANASGKPMTLAEFGGKPVRNLAGSVYRKGGEASAFIENFLQERDKLSYDRLRQDIAKYIHGGDTAFNTMESLLRSRSAAARPSYAESDELQGIWSPRLQQFLENPDVRTGMNVGYRFERNMSLAENRPFDPTQMGVDLDAQGNIKLLRTPNMRVLDMAKQGLDHMISENRDEITGRLNKIGLSLEKVRAAYVEELDKLDSKGVYRKAREAWAGPSKSYDSVKLGRSVFSMNPEETASEVAKLSASDKEFGRVGVADKLIEQLKKTSLSGDEAKKITNNRWTREQLEPWFKSSKDYDALIESVGREIDMFKLKSDVMGGSQTAERVEADRATDAMAATRGVHRLVTGNWIQAASDFYKLHRELGLRNDPELNTAIAKIIFSPNAPEGELAKKLLGKIEQQQSPEKAIHTTGAPYATGMAGEMARSLGASQAPDGNWYIPDASRPGKYIQVNP